MDRRAPRFAVNGVVADFDAGVLRDARGRIVPLRPQSFAVLRHLSANPDRVVGKDELMTSVWRGIAVTDDSLVQCIVEIRRAIGDASHAVVRTVPREGYRLHPPASRPSAPAGHRRTLPLVGGVAALLLLTSAAWLRLGRSRTGTRRGPAIRRR
jgi:DNA-binding winged helix-turn-helix (wHTH) protein